MKFSSLAAQECVTTVSLQLNRLEQIIFHSWYHVDGLVQEKCNSIAYALDLCHSCTNPSMFCIIMLYFIQYVTIRCMSCIKYAKILTQFLFHLPKFKTIIKECFCYNVIKSQSKCCAEFYNLSEYPTFINAHQGLYSPSIWTTYHQISWSLEATRLNTMMIV